MYYVLSLAWPLELIQPLLILILILILTITPMAGFIVGHDEPVSQRFPLVYISDCKGMPDSSMKRLLRANIDGEFQASGCNSQRSVDLHRVWCEC